MGIYSTFRRCVTEHNLLMYFKFALNLFKDKLTWKLCQLKKTVESILLFIKKKKYIRFAVI